MSATFDAYPTLGMGTGSKVYILGGTSVISANVENQLITRFGTANVVRISGPTQYDTNTAVINYVAANNLIANSNTLGINYANNARYNDTSETSSSSTTPSTLEGGAKTAIVASGDIRSYQDGIVSGPLSFVDGLPVILTTPTGLTASARTILVQGNYTQVVLLGGPLAVSNDVTTQLSTSVAAGGAGVTVFRVAGTDASDTSQLFARFLTDRRGSDVNMNLTDNGFPDGGVLIARGTGFQDALAAGPYAGESAYTPILLAHSATSLGAPLASYLKMVGSNGFFSVEAIGGPLSVSTGAQDAAIAAEVPGLGQ